jgi:uncharacterized protein
MKNTRIEFDWDKEKARANVFKHGVAFEEALSVFGDPLAMTLFDDKHSDDEERWITLGLNNQGRLIVVVHTYNELDALRVQIRIISARPATRREARQYQNEQTP